MGVTGIIKAALAAALAIDSTGCAVHHYQVCVAAQGAEMGASPRRITMARKGRHSL